MVNSLFLQSFENRGASYADAAPAGVNATAEALLALDGDGHRLPSD